jgi:radical SAM superfamily enzyme YgiQ (UPF0313 family)
LKNALRENARPPEKDDMKILLVNPISPDSFWSFQGLEGLVENFAHAPLGLATVAALTPSGFGVRIVDENIERVDLESDADVVGFTAFNVQIRRAVELAREFRARGKKVVIGGPYVSLVPEHFEDLFDTVFVGEAENIWPKYCRDLKMGVPKRLYREPEKIDITRSPVPRYDLIKGNRYNAFYLQTSRGCPNTCEFCDIIITDGRVPRTKTLDQVMEEVESVRRLGVTGVSFSDANFLGNPKFTKAVLLRLVEFGKKYNYPIRFSAELTINVAEREDILELLEQANFGAVFIGIESPRASSLKESGKGVNLLSPAIECIRKIQRHNIFPWAGMIVGFDNDDPLIFQEQFEFLMEAGIPFTTSGILVAIPTTPLYKRLEAAGRLTMDREEFRKASETWRGHGSDNLNFTPKQMGREELLAGYGWMIRRIYTYENFSRRLVSCMQHFRPASAESPIRRGQASFHIDGKKGLGAFGRILKYYVLTTDRRRRRFFCTTLFKALKGRWTRWNFSFVITYLVLQKHFYEYVTATQGVPEEASSASPVPRSARNPSPEYSDELGAGDLSKRGAPASCSVARPARVRRGA